MLMLVGESKNTDSIMKARGTCKTDGVSLVTVARLIAVCVGGGCVCCKEVHTRCRC